MVWRISTPNDSILRSSASFRIFSRNASVSGSCSAPGSFAFTRGAMRDCSFAVSVAILQSSSSSSSSAKEERGREGKGMKRTNRSSVAFLLSSSNSFSFAFCSGVIFCFAFFPSGFGLALALGVGLILGLRGDPIGEVGVGACRLDEAVEEGGMDGEEKEEEDWCGVIVPGPSVAGVVVGVAVGLASCPSALSALPLAVAPAAPPGDKPAASISVRSSSVIITSAREVISFISEISPIYQSGVY